MQPKQVETKSYIKEENSWIEESNTLVYQSQNLSECSEEKVDYIILDSKFVCVEQNEDISFCDISYTEDVDPLSIGLVKNEFKNFFPSVSVISNDDKISIDAGLMKEEYKYSPGSTFIHLEDFPPDVYTNRYCRSYFVLR